MEPVGIGNGQVQETFDHVEGGKNGWMCIDKGLPDFLSKCFGCFPELFDEGKEDKGIIAFKLGFSAVDGQVSGCQFLLVQVAQGLNDQGSYVVDDTHSGKLLSGKFTAKRAAILEKLGEIVIRK